MRMEAQLSTVPALAMQPTPALVAFVELLALPLSDLEERVERELATNPALDRDQGAACPTCGGPPAACACAAPDGPARRSPADGGGDLLELVACRRTLPERLLAEVRPALSSADRPIAEYLAGSLDGRGRLTEAPGDVAAALGVPVAAVQRVVELMRLLGPAGVTARDGRECLLLQLDRWEEEHAAESLVRRILDEHLEALAGGRLAAIARAEGVPEAEVVAARAFIRARLRPYPLQEAEPIEEAAGPRLAVTAPPEVLIDEASDGSAGFHVRVVEARRLRLTVDPLYERLAGSSPGAADGVGEHARSHLRRAQGFLHRLEQRWRTIQRVAECLVERQEAFLRGGPGQLLPLTRAELAADVGLHESTVSRAVSGKHARLPSGRVMPLSGFFDASLAPRELLRRLVATEARPLSDAALARMLTANGHPVARRTVAKYRAQLGIPTRGGR